MTKYIAVNELKDWVENWLNKNAYYHPHSNRKSIPVAELYDIVEQMPTVDAIPVRHGRWKFIRDEGDGNSLYECSECGRGDIHSPEVIVPYCWHCGAKMDGEHEAD